MQAKDVSLENVTYQNLHSLQPEILSSYLSCPINLFQMLNELNPSEMNSFISTFCHPDTTPYKKMQSLAMEEVYSENNSYAFICFALITHNITQLYWEKFSKMYDFLKAKHPHSPILESVRYIFHYCLKSQDVSFQMQLKKGTHSNDNFNSVPNYGNYSGLAFSNGINFLKNINFSNSNCNHVQFDNIHIENVALSNSTFVNANFNITYGKNCDFLNSDFTGATFIQKKDCLNLLTFKARLNTLYTLLSTSKNTGTIKKAIQINISETLHQLSDEKLKESLFEVFRNHPLITEHRNTLLWGINLIPSYFTGHNLISTANEKELLKVNNNTNALTDLESDSTECAKFIMDDQNLKIQINTKEYSSTNNFPSELVDALLSSLDKKSIASLKKTCGFFHKHPSVIKGLSNVPNLQLISINGSLLCLTSCGRLFKKCSNTLHYSFIAISKTYYFAEYNIGLPYGELIKHALHVDSDLVLVTQSNRLWLIDIIYPYAETTQQIKIPIPVEIALNLFENECIQLIKAGKKKLFISTNRRKFLVYDLFEKQITDKSKNLNLYETESVKQIEVFKDVIYILTSHSKIIYGNGDTFAPINMNGDYQYALISTSDSPNNDVIALAVTVDNKIFIKKTIQFIEHDISLQKNESIKQVVINYEGIWVLTTLGRILHQPTALFSSKGFDSFKISGLKKDEYATSIEFLPPSKMELLIMTNFGRLLECSSFRLTRGECTEIFSSINKAIYEYENLRFAI